MRTPRLFRDLGRETELSLMISRYMRKIDGAIIVAYHGVEPRENLSDPGIQSIHIDPGSFRRQIEFIARHFEIYGSIYDIDPMRRRSDRPAALITFDDGYKNFLTHALPVLEEFGIQTTLFLTVNCVEYQTRHPAYVSRALIGNLEPGEYDLESISEKMVITIDNRILLGAELAERMKQMPWQQGQLFISELEGMFEPRAREELHKRYSSDESLTWQEVGQLKNRGVLIGAHTLDHVILNEAQSEQVIKTQVIESRNLLMDRVGECRLFAYPNGSVRDISATAVNAVEEAEYDYAFTTVPGVVNSERFESTRFVLPRLSVSENWSGFRKYVSTAWRHNQRHTSFAQSVNSGSR